MALKPIVHILTLPLLLAGATGVSAQCLTPARDQISWWPGNGDARDVVGGNPGTMRNGAASVPGFVGPAFNFDGVDDVVTVPSSASLSFGPTAPITTDAWVYRTSGSPAMHLWGKRPGCAGSINYQMVIDETHGCSLGFGGDGGYACSGTSLPLNVWTHVTGSFDGVTFRLYVNGNLIAIGSGTLGPESDADFEIGDSGTCEHFGGLIDEVDIFNRALSDTEIQAIFEAGAGGKCLGTCIGNYSDGFNGNTLNPKWHLISGCGTPFTSAGVLVEHVDDNCNGTQTAFFDGSKDVLCGDYDVSIDFTLISWPLLPTGDRYSSLAVFNALGSNASVVERYRRYASYECWPHNDTYKFWSGNPDNCAATYFESSDLNGRFRIKREGSTLREYFWGSLGWIEQLTTSTDLAPVAIELYSAAANGLLVGHEVNFDNLVILSGASASSGTPTGGEVLDLTVTRTPSGDLTLSWGPSCAPGDDDYEVYDGRIGDFTSHSPTFCSTAGLTKKTFTPQTRDAYYLVVPRNSSREGSYGRSSDGSKRVQGVNACLPQETGGCP